MEFAPFLVPLIVGVVIGGIVGLCAGWLAKGREEVVVERTVEKIVERVPADLARKQHQANEVLAQLQLLTVGVSARIDAHTKTVDDINHELAAAIPSDGSPVVEAIRRLVDTNSAMQSQLEMAQEQLQQQASQLEQHQEAARTDALTKLRNRLAFDDEISRRLKEANSSGAPLALMMLDVDHFKKFNDTYGHLAGDEVLRCVGRVLIDNCIGNRSLFAARYGGEEFAVLISGQPLQDAAQLADAIRRKIEAMQVEFEGQPLKVTASAGIAGLDANDSGPRLIARADEALYAAKKAGRNGTCIQDKKTIKKIMPSEAEESEAAANASSNNELLSSLWRRIAEWRRGGTQVSLIVARFDPTPTAAAGSKNQPISGDILIQHMTRIVRDMDHVARLPGDLIGAVLPSARLGEAARIAERIRQRAEQGDLDEVIGTRRTLSLGVAEVAAEDDGDTLLLRARRALESASRRGGNSVFVNDGVLSTSAQDALDSEAARWAGVP